MIYGVIPARYGSTRLPGKMLLEVEGKPVLWHTWNRASKAATLDRLVIAAGDEIIAQAARSWGAEVVETFEECQSGSDRVWQAYEKVQNGEVQADALVRHSSARAIGADEGVRLADIIINIQGDEVQLDPMTIDAVVEKLLADPEAGVGTAAAPIADEADYYGDAIVKVVLDANDRALYFSRSPIPYGLNLKSQISNLKSYRHIGIYAYRQEALERFVSLPPSPLELSERLEQLRLVEQGVRYCVAIVEHAGVEVNTAEDLAKVRGETSVVSPNYLVGFKRLPRRSGFQPDTISFFF